MKLTVNMSTVLLTTLTIGVSAGLHWYAVFAVGFISYLTYFFMLIKKDAVC